MDFVSQRRTDGPRVSINGHKVVLRDQAPLHKGDIQFSIGWSFRPDDDGSRSIPSFRLREPKLSFNLL
jgi:hypothetical protein